MVDQQGVLAAAVSWGAMVSMDYLGWAPAPVDTRGVVADGGRRAAVAVDCGSSLAGSID